MTDYLTPRGEQTASDEMFERFHLLFKRLNVGLGLEVAVELWDRRREVLVRWSCRRTLLIRHIQSYPYSKTKVRVADLPELQRNRFCSFVLFLLWLSRSVMCNPCFNPNLKHV